VPVPVQALQARLRLVPVRLRPELVLAWCRLACRHRLPQPRAGSRRCSRSGGGGRRCSIGGAGRGHGDAGACRWRSCSRGACCGSGRTCGFGGCRNLAQLGHIAFELIGARRLVCGLFLLGHLLIGGHALDGALGQGQLVGGCGGGLGICDMGLNLAGSAARCCFHRGHRCHASQLTAELVEILRLGRHDLACFLGRGGLGGRLIGQLDHASLRMRLILPLTKACGLLRSMATSI
jgi:hypothetical protein